MPGEWWGERCRMLGWSAPPLEQQRDGQQAQPRHRLMPAALPIHTAALVSDALLPFPSRLWPLP